MRNGVFISISWHPRAYGCMDLWTSQTVIIEELIEKIRPFIIIVEKYKSKHCYVFCREILIDLSHPLRSFELVQWNAAFGSSATRNSTGDQLTEDFFLFLFADPGGIGSAFHRAGKTKRNKPRPFGQNLFLNGLPGV